jgi:uncharacterized membrane protein YidH (DUF202 family)
MSLVVTNYIAGTTQLILSVFLIIWLVLLLMNGESLSFVVGEYNGDNGDGVQHGRIPLTTVVMLLVLFTLITGLVHILAYGKASQQYRSEVDKGNNWIRWAEYSVTATIMLFVIALVSGTSSTDTLVMVATASFCCMICGFLSESTARSDPRVSKLATLIGWLLLLSSFGVILRRFGSIIHQAQTNGSDGPPSFVWAIIGGMTALYMSFGVIHLVHMRKQWNSKDPVPPDFHRRIERAYTIASVTAKILLVVLLASGLFARETMNIPTTE